MNEENRVIAIQMTEGQPQLARHIEKLYWYQGGKEVWSYRATMVKNVDTSPKGTFFTNEGGVKASLYVAGNGTWVETEPDGTRVNNLLSLPRRR
jgi:hypothetical protein